MSSASIGPKQMRRIDTSAWWKYTATSAVTLVMAGGGFWLADGHKFVKRDEVKAQIAESSPYTKEGPALKQQLAYMTELLVDLRAQQEKATQFQTSRNEDMRREITELQRQVALISQKLEAQP